MDIATSRNVTLNETTLQVMSSGIKSGPCQVARDEWYREDTVPDIMFKYFNTRKNDFSDNTHSRTGTPYNVQNPDYKRRQNHSSEYQFDFWESYEKMIVNGYKGDFLGDSDVADRGELESSLNNKDTMTELCLKTGLDFGSTGALTFDAGKVEFYCKVAAYEDTNNGDIPQWFDNEGVRHEEPLTSEHVVNYSGNSGSTTVVPTTTECEKTVNTLAILGNTICRAMAWACTAPVLG